MKCFTHPESDGVAVCRACGRSLCHNCSADVDGKCACKGRCEERVKNTEEVIDRNIRVYGKLGGLYNAIGSFMLVVGACLVVLSVYSAIHTQEGESKLLNLVPALFGTAFVLLGQSYFRAARQFAKPRSAD